jgi:sterol desaturase/sphingolipid hydroxylase (fatty acid hydroxylase superfamily)
MRTVEHAEHAVRQRKVPNWSIAASLSVWQTFLTVSILFHHSNARLPLEVERKLNRICVTPRMHSIHHSIVKEETNSNWSTGLTIWDRLHGTLRLSKQKSDWGSRVPRSTGS